MHNLGLGLGVNKRFAWAVSGGSDVTPPSAVSFSPTDNATGVNVSTLLIVQFDSLVVLGTGNVTLKKTSDNSTVEAWNVATEAGTGAGQVSVEGLTQLTMRLTTSIAGSTEYYVIWDANVVKDIANNPVAAQASTTLWSFTTEVVSSYQAETDAIAAAFTTPPTTARKNLIDACVVSLKTGGVWAKSDCIYVLAAADSQAATINWKAPGSFNLTIVNAPIFTADRGFNPASIGVDYLDSTWDPATNGVTYLRDSASLHVWNNTESRANSQMTIGYYPSSAAINPWNSSIDTMAHSINSASQNTFGAGGPAVGFFSVSRNSSANYDVHKNGALLGNQATASTAVVSNDFRILSSTGLHTSKQLAFGAWGGGLTSTEVTTLYNTLRTYMTGVGVP